MTRGGRGAPAGAATRRGRGASGARPGQGAAKARGASTRRRGGVKPKKPELASISGHVVFLRAANVGGRNVFRPAELARALDHLDVANVGAAGTFVVRAKASAATIRREIREHLPFEPKMAVVPARDVLALVRSDPFAGVAFSKDLRGWVAVLDGRPRGRPDLPVSVPGGKNWSVRFERLDGCFALGRWRRSPGGFVFPSDVVEKAVGMPATTRWWETLQRVAGLVDAR